MFKPAKFFLILGLLLATACSAAPVVQNGSTTEATATSPVAATVVVASATPASIADTLTPTTAPAMLAATQTTALTSAQTSTPAAAAVPASEMVFNLVTDKSSADYRVREQLARLNLPSDAIGKTSQINGSVAVKADGSIDSSASKITVDISSLASDSSMRDGFVGRTILQTGQYPTVVFVPTSVSGLAWPLPQSGPVSFKVTGNLTVKDVTKPVTWDVTGAIQNGVATGTATTSFTFEDFGLSQPHVPVVLSVVDHIALEVSVTFQQAGN